VPLVDEVDRRTGRLVNGSYLNWTQHPNNPLATAARKPLEPLEPAE
jgi:dihydropyrimidine dehydrogenase (NAD+) subunit PreA